MLPLTISIFIADVGYARVFHSREQWSSAGSETVSRERILRRNQIPRWKTIAAIRVVLAFARFCAIGAANESCAEIKFARRKQWRWFISRLIRSNSPSPPLSPRWKQICRQNRINARGRILRPPPPRLFLHLVHERIARYVKNKMSRGRSRAAAFIMSRVYLARDAPFRRRIGKSKNIIAPRFVSPFVFSRATKIDAARTEARERVAAVKRERERERKRRKEKRGEKKILNLYCALCVLTRARQMRHRPYLRRDFSERPARGAAGVRAIGLARPR